ncbi:curli production assembly/transport component CsgF [Algoriphagus sediminis]|uniref:Curli production assembly/transport component CsgF n=1 Tax=Algoriphagus sediminis TaxID=3057113 RepID=A0ABT7Y8D3_9BACT|nr:curli production assembly/transport component CsgF [Algoriphagus sediminis]MDN3202735.1 curli assembly protein CsgF [Algoriphagus sediminis]
MKKIILTLFFLCAFASVDSFGQQLRFRFTNPAFGGDTFNYQWMLNSAQAQDTFEDPRTSLNEPFGRNADPLSNFSEDLNRQILSRLSRELVTRQFGEDQINEGNYVLGDYQINIGNTGSGLNITITDSRTGASSVVEVPFF